MFSITLQVCGIYEMNIFVGLAHNEAVSCSEVIGVNQGKKRPLKRQQGRFCDLMLLFNNFLLCVITEGETRHGSLHAIIFLDWSIGGLV